MNCINDSDDELQPFALVWLDGIMVEGNELLWKVTPVPTFGYFTTQGRIPEDNPNVPPCVVVDPYITYFKRITGWFGFLNENGAKPHGRGKLTIDFPCVGSLQTGVPPGLVPSFGIVWCPAYNLYHGRPYQYGHFRGGNTFCDPIPDPLPEDKKTPTTFTESFRSLYTLNESVDGGESELHIVTVDFLYWKEEEEEEGGGGPPGP